MHDYRLTAAAKKDFVGIAEYGDQKFGVFQSERYQDQLQQQFSDIAANPLMYPVVDEAPPGFRRCVCGAHSIYYRVDERGVEIVRILNRQDLARAFGG